MRIRVEMSFGRLTNKWGIFRKNLNFALPKAAKIIHVAAILHNFVINEQQIKFNQVDFNSGNMETAFGVVALPDAPRGFCPVLPTREDSDSDSVSSEENEAGDRRAAIVAEITTRDMQRPLHNLERNSELDADSVYEEE